MSVCPSIRPSVRLLPAFLEIGSLFFADFWHKDVKWLCQKCDGAQFLKIKFFGENLGQKLSKSRVFWTLCKIASLVFPDFWHRDRVQGTLKCGQKIISQKKFFVVNYRFSYFGEIPFYHLPAPLIIVAKNIFFSNFDDNLFFFQSL